ncbi:MAG: HD domain-containing protein [Patescibacteria group bacterium]|nr:HD domain-containing protein [Patescibacteria group bacterium]
MKHFHIPLIIKTVNKAFKNAGFEAFLVGGCVRDILEGKIPKDWDITTNAVPEETLKIFPDGKYENNFGTVLVPEKYISGEEDGKEIIEITTYRMESPYSDKRHPDSVQFAKTLKEDLSRRDFTINAIALEIQEDDKYDDRRNIVDEFGGIEDLRDKKIRAVGDPWERFSEDALRMMRAVRFAVQLGFEIEPETFKAIKQNAGNLKLISKERIRDELVKIICSNQPGKGIELCVELGLMEYIIPEILDTIGIKQNRHHYHGPFNTVYKHMIASLDKCPSKLFEVRLASFLHDIGKPGTKQGEGEFATFHGHEYLGARMTQKILERLKFSRKIVDRTVLLVKNHMFYYDVNEVGESGVRRVVRKVGLENINDLIDVRIADRLGSGVPKAVPYKLRHFRYMVEKVSKDPISVKQLKIGGHDLMESLNIKPGPEVGAILDVLLSEAIDDPSLNTKSALLKLAQDLKEKNLKSLRSLAKKKILQQQKKQNTKIKKKYWVK